MKQKKLSEGHHWLIERMLKPAYRANKKGICFNVAHAGMEMFLGDELDFFNMLLSETYTLNEKKLRVKLFNQANVESLKQLKIKNKIFESINDKMRVTIAKNKD